MEIKQLVAGYFVNTDFQYLEKIINTKQGGITMDKDKAMTFENLEEAKFIVNMINKHPRTDSASKPFKVTLMTYKLEEVETDDTAGK